MEILMHTCCAPCSVSCIRQLRGEGIERGLQGDVSSMGFDRLSSS